MFEASLSKDMLINIARAAKEMYLRPRLNPDDLLGHGERRVYMSPCPPAGKVETSIAHRSSLLAL
jgi:hypothetical protein